MILPIYFRGVQGVWMVNNVYSSLIIALFRTICLYNNRLIRYVGISKLANIFATGQFDINMFSYNGSIE